MAETVIGRPMIAVTSVIPMLLAVLRSSEAVLRMLELLQFELLASITLASRTIGSTSQLQICEFRGAIEAVRESKPHSHRRLSDFVRVSATCRSSSAVFAVRFLRFISAAGNRDGC